MLPLLPPRPRAGRVRFSTPAIAEVAELTVTTPAEVRGTALFYDMFHLEPVGKYVVGICTNIACLLAGGDELLEHAVTLARLPVGSTSNDGLFTLEETECLADCDIAPCVQVNHRYVRTRRPSLRRGGGELRAGTLDHDVPNHGTLIRVRRTGGLHAPRAEVASRAGRGARAARSARGGDEVMATLTAPRSFRRERSSLTRTR
jgi:NADH-quinone oxidoreductase subunit E